MSGWNSKNIIKTESTLNKSKDIEHNYLCDLVNFTENETPFFIKMVLNDDHLNEVSKKEFKKKFLLKYLRDINYRKKVIGKYLFWFNKKFMGLIDDIYDSIEYGTSKDDRYFIQISNHFESSFLNHSIQGNYMDEYNGYGKVLNTFNTNLLISNSENPKKNDVILESYMIIDTGCTITSLPTDYWDYE